MKTKVINISKEQYTKVRKMVEEKANIHRKIREGKFSEISPDIKFIKPC